MELSQELLPESVPLDVVWKDHQSNLSDDLANLSQYVGSYAMATIFKVIEVQQLVKEKDGKFLRLEKTLLNSRHDIE